MRKPFWVVGLIAGLMLAAWAPVASADVGTLPQPRPAWLTDQLEAKILAAGSSGVEVTFDRSSAQAALQPNCLGTAPPHAGTDGASIKAVSAATCMVSPNGCTMNFIFTDGTSNYIGTAGHCAGAGKTVIAQVATRVD